MSLRKNETPTVRYGSDGGPCFYHPGGKHTQGLAQLSGSIHRQIFSKYLRASDHAAFISTSTARNDWSRNFVLEKVKKYQPLDRDSSWKLVHSPTAEVEALYPNDAIFPIELTFHQEDVSALQKVKDVFNFIRRVKKVTFKGTDSREQLVIEATKSANVPDEAKPWSMAMYDLNAACWALDKSQSLEEVLDLDEVKAVTSLELYHATANNLDIKLSWSFIGADITWRATKTHHLKDLPLEGASALDILQNPKLKIFRPCI